MISTLGEALNLGWKVRVACAQGKRDGMRSIRECIASFDLDLPTLIWTRGRDFPIARLETRMRCPRCGSRQVRILFEPPASPARRPAVVDVPWWAKLA